MNNRLNIQDVAELLAERTGRNREEAERFLRLFVEVITEGVLQDQVVKVKGVGTFKLIAVDARESVHVHTGERFMIPAHYKFSYTPDKELREAVNRPFSAFETTEILNPAVGEGLEEEVTSFPAEPTKGEMTESVEELLPDREISLPQPGVKQEASTDRPVEPMVAGQPDVQSKAHETGERSSWSWLSYGAVALLLVVVACAFYFLGQNRAYKMLERAQSVEVVQEQSAAKEFLEKEPEDSLLIAAQEELQVETEAMVEKPSEPEEWTEKKVVIRRGDRLTNIALEHYGHKLFWVYIYQHNQVRITDPNNVPIGTELTLPPPQLYSIDAKSKASLEAAALLQTKILTGK